MNTIRKNPRPSKGARRNILLALGWNVTEFNQGVAEYAKKSNWILNDMMCHNGRVPSNWNGDGIITLITGSDEKPLLRLLRSTSVPVVNLGPYESPMIRCRVLHNNEMIGKMAAEHLLGRGFEHFAFYCVSSHPNVKERMQGFRQTILSAGKAFFALDFSSKMPALCLNSTQYERLLSWIALQLKKLPKPIAVMAQYDGEANDVVRACLAANLLIPEEVAVIGVDNDPIYSMLGPVPLTSVESNRRLLGYRAAEVLDQILDGKEPVEKTTRIQPGGVTVRESTDMVAVGDPHVAKALRFILDGFKTGIGVEAVVSSSGISRRGLYSRFESIIGHTIFQEILNRRLEYAMQLLRESDAKLYTIAEAAGFVDAQRLCKSFKRYTGHTPLDYRRETRIVSGQIQW